MVTAGAPGQDSGRGPGRPQWPPEGPPQRLAGLNEIAGAYDAFLIDQWGVLWFGGEASQPAIDALHRLRAADKRMVLITNSPRRAVTVRRNFEEIGIDPALFDDIVTAGDEVCAAFGAGEDPFFADLGRRCLALQWKDDPEFFEELDLECVDSVETAEFILLLGTNRPQAFGYAEMLDRALKRGLPMVCANHDFVAITRDGTLVDCPGSVGRLYEEKGGRVSWHGKPRPAIYARATREWAGAGRILAIGDSLFHDIGGAGAMAYDALLVASGIHRGELAAKDADAGDAGAAWLDPARLDALCRHHGAWPDYVMRALAW